MSLALIKSYILPSIGESRYAPLRASSPIEDIEQGSSTKSSFDESTEKPMDKHTSQPRSARVNPRIIADATLGLADGLTVPFALTAGLSALGDTKVVIYGGLAELIAGSVSMGVGGYLGAKSEAEGYQAKLSETKAVVANEPTKAHDLVRSTFEEFEFTNDVLDSMIATLETSPRRLVNFIMCFHHQLAEADYTRSKAYISGLTISAGYFLGGLVPLLPYFFVSDVWQALNASVVLMAVALFTFGWLKTSLVGETSRSACLRSAIQMVVLGGVAAAAAMGCVKAVGT